MRVDIIGAGPAGLLLATLLRRDGVRDVRVFEATERDVTAGWAVVFPEGSLKQLASVDPHMVEAIQDAGVSWTAVEIHHRSAHYRVHGNRFHGISRDVLVSILRGRAESLGVQITYGHRVKSLAGHADADLVVGADGINSKVRELQAQQFGPTVESGSFRYGWFGIEADWEAFGYVFVETEWGLFQGYIYPSGQSWSSLILYVCEETWQRSGLAEMDVDESLRFCEQVFAEILQGRPILRRGPAWAHFRHLSCINWHTDDTVLIGDAAHTSHWSIGSGTRLAMEDAIALAAQLRASPDEIPEALGMYEKVRRDRVERFQEAGQLSERYFDTAHRFIDFAPAQFAFQLVSRSWQITFADIARRDPEFIRRFNSWFHAQAGAPQAHFAPSPTFAPINLAGLQLSNRIVTRTPVPGAGLLLENLAPVDLSAHRVGELLASPALGVMTVELVAGLRASQPAGSPVGVVLALAAGCDSAKQIADTLLLVRTLARCGVDVVLLQPVDGDDPPPPGAITQVADEVRNQTPVLVIVDDAITTVDAADTVLAAGRADLCVLQVDATDAIISGG